MVEKVPECIVNPLPRMPQWLNKPKQDTASSSTWMSLKPLGNVIEGALAAEQARKSYKFFKR